jgi:Leucine-rich repeat (LRR) protein
VRQLLAVYVLARVFTDVELQMRPLFVHAPVNILAFSLCSCSLANADILFRLPNLQHAGLSYNMICSLPKDLLPGCTSLLSLDISHNSMDSLDQTFASIQALPSLQVLKKR